MLDPVAGPRPDRGRRITQAYQALNRCDLDSFCSILDPQVITVEPGLGNPTGPAAVVADLRAAAVAFPDLRYEVEQVLDAPPRTVARLRMRGTHRGRWGRHPATGRRIDVALCEVCEWLDDRIVVRRLYWDRRAALIQLGLD